MRSTSSAREGGTRNARPSTSCLALRPALPQRLCPRLPVRPTPARGSRASSARIRATLERPPSRDAGSYFWNSELLQGDLIMVMCTIFASSRVPVPEVPFLGATMLTAWLLTATVRGDYTRENDANAGLDDLSFKMGVSMYRGVLGACHTWWFYTIACTVLWSAVYLTRVQCMEGFVDWGMHDFAGVPPYVETIVAQALTLSCWRGLAALFFKKED